MHILRVLFIKYYLSAFLVVSAPVTSWPLFALIRHIHCFWNLLSIFQSLGHVAPSPKTCSPKPCPNPANGTRSKATLVFLPLSLIIPTENHLSIPWNSDLGDKYNFFISHFLCKRISLNTPDFLPNIPLFTVEEWIDLWRRNRYMPIFFLESGGGVYLFIFNQKSPQGVIWPQGIIIFHFPSGIFASCIYLHPHPLGLVRLLELELELEAETKAGAQVYQHLSHLSRYTAASERTLPHRALKIGKMLTIISCLCFEVSFS